MTGHVYVTGHVTYTCCSWEVESELWEGEGSLKFLPLNRCCSVDDPKSIVAYEGLNPKYKVSVCVDAPGSAKFHVKHL